jgi:hypothetical protein
MIDHVTSPSNAEVFNTWINERGGVAVWQSIDLSDPGYSVSTPALTPDGTPTPKPHWKVGTIPAVVYTDPSQIGIIEYKEYARFHVAYRRSSNGLSYKLTDASTRNLRRRLSAAEKKVPDASLAAWVTYTFDYRSQEAVILVPESIVSLPEYLEAQKSLDF